MKNFRLEYYDKGTDLSSDMKTAKNILDSLAKANFNAYNYWWCFQPSWASKDTDGYITQSGSATKRGYMVAQFAKY